MIRSYWGFFLFVARNIDESRKGYHTSMIHRYHRNLRWTPVSARTGPFDMPMVFRWLPFSL